MLINILVTKPPKPPPSGGAAPYLLTTCLMLFAPLFIGTICSTNVQSLTPHSCRMVYGRFERGRPRSGRSRVRFGLFWYGCCLHALENRRAWPTNAGRSAEDSRGSGLLRLAPIPGLDGPPLGEPRDGRTAHISKVFVNTA